MADHKPDFYLGSSEQRDQWAKPRYCWVAGKIKGPDRECLWIRVEPHVIGQPYGLGGNNIEDLLVAPHSANEQIRLPLKRKISVYIYRILDPKILAQGRFEYKDVELTAWGELYPSWKSAAKQAKWL